MTTKPNDAKPSERYLQLIGYGQDFRLSREDAFRTVVLAYLDEQHAAGQHPWEAWMRKLGEHCEHMAPWAEDCLRCPRKGIDAPHRYWFDKASERAAGQGERESVFSEANKKRAWDSAIESLAAKGVDVDGLLKRGAEAIRLLPVSRVEEAAEAKLCAHKWGGGNDCTYCVFCGVDKPALAVDHRTPPRNPSAAFGSDDCKTCGGLRRVRKGDSGLWELCPECWAKDGAEHGPVAEPPSPESLPHRAGLPLPVDTDEPAPVVATRPEECPHGIGLCTATCPSKKVPPSPVAGEPGQALLDAIRAEFTSREWRNESVAGAQLLPAVVSCLQSLDWHRNDEIPRLNGYLVARTEERDTLKSKLASVEAELQRAYESNSDNAKLLRTSQSALAEANARAGILENEREYFYSSLDELLPVVEKEIRHHGFSARHALLTVRAIIDTSRAASAKPPAPSQPPQDAQPGQLLYPNGPELALQNPPGYTCWRCGSKPKPQMVLDPSQPEGVQPVEGVAAGRESVAVGLPDVPAPPLPGSAKQWCKHQSQAYAAGYVCAQCLIDENPNPPATPEPVTGEKP